MSRVLLTAFEPYEQWSTNASWMLIERLTQDLPAEPQITTRRYPVDFEQLRSRLEDDIADNYDAALLLGQAPNRSSIDLEAIGLNVAWPHDALPAEAKPLVEEGPVAYRSSLPLASWARELREHSIPARVSYHAGAYMCNAALYLSHYFAEQRRLNTRVAFVHVPLDPSQVAHDRCPGPSLPIEISTMAVRWMLDQLTEPPVV